MQSIKRLIKSTFAGEYLVSVLHCMECKIVPALIDDETAVKRYYYKSTGKQLDLDNPQTFSEKLNWYKLQTKDPLMAVCADKYAVREYIVSKGYADTLNELYGVYNSASEIDLNKLPESFVIKASHGSHMNLIVKSKEDYNWRQQKLLMDTWLHQDIYWSGREWVYKDIPRRIIVERYLEDKYGGLRDYKFYCFNGVPRYIDVDVDRFTNHYRNFYDTEWNFIPMTSIVPNNPDAVVSPPQNLSSMVEMAKDLSAPFQFVRVDLYEVEGKIYFGELTFFQDGGNPGYTEDYDKLVGSYWKKGNNILQE